MSNWQIDILGRIDHVWLGKKCRVGYAKTIQTCEHGIKKKRSLSNRLHDYSFSLSQNPPFNFLLYIIVIHQIIPENCSSFQ